MVKTRYVCEVCGFGGDDNAEISAHEKIPVTGNVYQFGAAYKLSDEHDLHIGVVIGETMNIKHQRKYEMLDCAVVEGVFDMSDPVRLLESDISELTDIEFQEARKYFGVNFADFHRGTLPSKE